MFSIENDETEWAKLTDIQILHYQDQINYFWIKTLVSCTLNAVYLNDWCMFYFSIYFSTFYSYYIQNLNHLSPFFLYSLQLFICIAPSYMFLMKSRVGTLFGLSHNLLNPVSNIWHAYLTFLFWMRYSV